MTSTEPRSRNALGQFVKETREVQEVQARVIERRDPSAATTPLQFLSPSWPMVPEWDAETAVRWGYLANTFVYRCVQVIARNLAELKFRAGRDPDRPTEYDVSAPLARLLGPPPQGPNPATSARQLWANAVTQYLVTGRFGWEMEKPQGVTGTDWAPVALYPLPSSSLRAVPSSGGSQWFSSFEYGPAHAPTKLSRDRVLYHWQPSLTDWREPESALQAARLDVSVAVMQDRYDHAFLRNDARPAAVVVHEVFADAEERDAWRRQFESRHRGPDSAGKVAFAEMEGGDGDVSKSLLIETLGLSQRDAEFAKRYESKIRAICVAFGVPLTLLGDASGRTFSNASEEVRVFWEQTMLPLLADFADAVNIQLAPRLGPEVGWFDLSTVEVLRHRVDPITASVGAPTLVQAQLMTINEARSDYGLPPVDDGDRFMTVEEITLLKGSDAGPAVRTRGVEHGSGSPDPGSGSAAAGDGEPGVASEGGAGVRAGVVRPLEPRSDAGGDVHGLRAQPPGRDPGISEQRSLERRASVAKATERYFDAQEDAFERVMRTLFAQQQASVMNRLTGKRGRRIETRQSADDLFDRAFWEERTAEQTLPLIATLTRQGGLDVIAQLAVDFELAAEEIDQLILARANQLAGEVTDTTYRSIQDAMVQGVAEGEGIPGIASRIQHVFDVANESRATTIARTEVVSAYNAGKRTQSETLPDDVAAGQEWVATRDGRTRDSHASADGQVVPKGEPFTVGGVQAFYPGDTSLPAKETVNCRCTVIILTPEEFAERTALRTVPSRAARAALRLVVPGSFDEQEFRRALWEIAA